MLIAYLAFCFGYMTAMKLVTLSAYAGQKYQSSDLWLVLFFIAAPILVPLSVLDNVVYIIRKSV